MPTRPRRAHVRPTFRRVLALTASLSIATAALVFGGATAAQAVAVGVSIHPTNATT